MDEISQDPPVKLSSACSIKKGTYWNHCTYTYKYI
jgi:hypothetical protein